MRRTINLHDNFVSFGIPFLLIFSLVCLTKTSWFHQYPKELSIGITLDLILIIPFVYYLLIRKKAIPKITILTMFIIGLIVSTLVIPVEYQKGLSLVKTFVLPIIELAILYIVITKTRAIIRSYKNQKRGELDFYDALKIAVEEVVPAKLSSLVVTEIAVIYYGFFSWKKRELNTNEYSYHKKSTSVSILLGFILLILIEIITLHHLLSMWSLIAAWVLTFLSIYTCFQMMALLKSLSKRPFFIDEANQQLVLRYGFFSEAVIPFLEIKKISIYEKEISDDKSITSFSPFGKLEGVNMLIELFNKTEFNSFYGFKKKYTSLAFFVDEKHQFVKRIETIVAKK